MENELIPCPFCCGPAEYKELHFIPDEGSRGYVRCKNECCEQSFVTWKDDAIEHWNRREKE